eukprot:gene17412-biopygen3857
MPAPRPCDEPCWAGVAQLAGTHEPGNLACTCGACGRPTLSAIFAEYTLLRANAHNDVRMGTWAVPCLGFDGGGPTASLPVKVSIAVRLPAGREHPASDRPGKKRRWARAGCVPDRAPRWGDAGAFFGRGDGVTSLYGGGRRMRSKRCRTSGVVGVCTTMLGDNI